MGERPAQTREQVADLPPTNRRETLAEWAARTGRPPVRPGEKSRDYVARLAGFSSATQYRNTKLVMEHGAPNVIEAMNKNELAISTAADVVRFVPLEDQRGLTVKELKALARLYRRAKAEAKVADQLHRVLLRPGGPDEPMTPDEAASLVPEEFAETVLAQAEKRLAWLWAFVALMRDGKAS